MSHDLIPDLPSEEPPSADISLSEDLVDVESTELSCDVMWHQVDACLTQMLGHGNNGLPRRLSGHWLNTKMLISKAYSMLELSEPLVPEDLNFYHLLDEKLHGRSVEQKRKDTLTALCCLTQTSFEVHRRISLNFTEFLEKAMGLKIPCDPHPSFTEAFSVMISKYLTSEFSTLERLAGNHESLGLFDFYPAFFRPPAAAFLFSVSPSHSRHLPMSACALATHYLAWSAMNAARDGARDSVSAGFGSLDDVSNEGEEKVAIARYSANSWMDCFHIAHVSTIVWGSTIGGAVALNGKKTLRKTPVERPLIPETVRAQMNSKMFSFFASFDADESRDPDYLPDYACGSNLLASFSDPSFLDDLRSHRFMNIGVAEIIARKLVGDAEELQIISKPSKIMEIKVALMSAMLRDLKVARSKSFRWVGKFLAAFRAPSVESKEPLPFSPDQRSSVRAALATFINDSSDWLHFLRLENLDGYVELLTRRAEGALEMEKMAAHATEHALPSKSFDVFQPGNDDVLIKIVQTKLKTLACDSLKIVENWFFCDSNVSEKTAFAYEEFGKRCRSRLFENFPGGPDRLGSADLNWLPEVKHYAFLARHLVARSVFQGGAGIRFLTESIGLSTAYGYPKGLRSPEEELSLQISSTLKELGVEVLGTKTQGISLFFHACEKALRSIVENPENSLDLRFAEVFRKNLYPADLLKRLADRNPGTFSSAFKNLALRVFGGQSLEMDEVPQGDLLFYLHFSMIKDVKTDLTAKQFQRLRERKDLLPKCSSTSTDVENFAQASKNANNFSEIWQDCSGSWELVGLEEKLELQIPFPNPTKKDERTARTLWMMAGADRELSCKYYSQHEKIQLMGDLQRFLEIIRDKLLQKSNLAQKLADEHSASLAIVEKCCKSLLETLSSENEVVDCTALHERTQRLETIAEGRNLQTLTKNFILARQPWHWQFTYNKAMGFVKESNRVK